jgi:hypothetical protein
MLQCGQPSQMPAGLRPRWISAATKLVGPLLWKLNFGAWMPSRFLLCGHIPFPVEATDRGRRSFVAHHEN